MNSSPIDPPIGITIRLAEADDRVDALRVLEGALLEVDPAVLHSAIDGERVILAETDPATEAERTHTVVGALVLDRFDDRLHIDAVAVTRHRREVGIGSALVRAAIDLAATRQVAQLTATFDHDLREFYADLGFRIELIDGADRLRGVVATATFDRHC